MRNNSLSLEIKWVVTTARYTRNTHIAPSIVYDLRLRPRKGYWLKIIVLRPKNGSQKLTYGNMLKLKIGSHGG